MAKANQDFYVKHITNEKRLAMYCAAIDSYRMVRPGARDAFLGGLIGNTIFNIFSRKMPDLFLVFCCSLFVLFFLWLSGYCVIYKAAKEYIQRASNLEKQMRLSEMSMWN